MRVAVVCPYSFDEPGGVQSQSRELVERLLAAGDDAWLVGPGIPSREAPMRSVGGSVRIPANRSRAPISLAPVAMSRVRKSLAGADVVHVHEPLMPVVSWAAVRARPAVLTFHADPSRAVRRTYRILSPLLGRLTAGAGITAVSEVAASAIRPFAHHVEIIPNGVDVGFFRPAGVGAVPGRVAFLGRDEPRKGLDVLKAAWASIRARVPGATLHVMGATGSDGDGIRYLGRADESTKRQELAAATVFCAPNLGGESFGITLVEAMAARCAVVASDLESFRAVASDAALFVPPGESAALAEAVVALLRNEPRMLAMSDAGMRRARRYDWNVIVPRYRQVYQQTAAELRRPGGR